MITFAFNAKIIVVPGLKQTALTAISHGHAIMFSRDLLNIYPCNAIVDKYWIINPNKCRAQRVHKAALVLLAEINWPFKNNSLDQ